MKIRTEICLVIIGICLVALGVFSSLPTGTGEYQMSPDEKWVAGISDLNSGAFFWRKHYLKLEIQRVSDERTIVRKFIPLSTHDEVPDYADRSRKNIVWSPDSKTATFQTKNFDSTVLVVNSKYYISRDQSCICNNFFGLANFVVNPLSCTPFLVIPDYFSSKLHLSFSAF